MATIRRRQETQHAPLWYAKPSLDGLGCPAPAPEGAVLEYTKELEKFLAEIERRAFRMAHIALRDTDDALDVVQDAMLKLAATMRRAQRRMEAVVLSHPGERIRDLQRRRSVRSAS